MPNHVKNRLTVTSRALPVLHTIRGEDPSMYIDFNRIVPMPEDLDIEDVSTGEQAAKYLYELATTFLSLRPKLENPFSKWAPEEQESALELGKQYLRNIANYGHPYWYGWCIENWGTKWNAYSQSKVSDNTIEFETAWSAPVDLLAKLSAMFPGVVFEYAYADEDTGANCGIGTFHDGIAKIACPPSYSRDAYELAFALWPERKENYVLEGDNYEYKEEEEE